VLRFRVESALEVRLCFIDHLTPAVRRVFKWSGIMEWSELALAIGGSGLFGGLVGGFVTHQFTSNRELDSYKRTVRRQERVSFTAIYVEALNVLYEKGRVLPGVIWPIGQDRERTYAKLNDGSESASTAKIRLCCPVDIFAHWVKCTDAINTDWDGLMESTTMGKTANITWIEKADDLLVAMQKHLATFDDPSTPILLRRITVPVTRPAEN
jgi:hypothetical protein